MDVRCARCGIEYEFDDALISERGTMVRCTECGHQFRVHPSHVIPGAPDEWRVVTRDGQAISYRTLRELQQGITQGQVGRDATLVRGSSPPRPLGTIAELDPFFPAHPTAPREESTLSGVAPPALELDPNKPTQATGRVPIARIGLNSVQVSATGVGLTAPRPVGRPRKTTLGLGEKKPKEEKTSDESSDETQVTAKVSPPAHVPTQPPAPFPTPAPTRTATPAPTRIATPEPTRTATPAPSPATVKVEEAKPPVPRRQEQVPPKTAVATTLTKPVAPKQEVSTRASSEPPTLRGGETPPAQQETQKRFGSAPPRPARQRGPTLVGGYEAPAKVSPAAQHAPVKVGTSAKPTTDPPAITDPPAAIRALRDETLLSEPQPPRIEKTEPLPKTFAPSTQTHAVVPPALDPSDADESMALVFQAEAPPLESSLSSPTNDEPEPQRESESEPTDAGAFVPTVPPKRLLSLADAVTTSENRARSSRIGRWLMAGLLIVLLSLVALWLRSRASTRSGGEVATGAAGLEQYLQNANTALRAGDLVRAHDQLQTSQTLGGRDARWVTLTARYDVMRADMNWLAVRLADPNDTVHVETLKRELSDNMAQATRALNSIERLAVSDPELPAARLDAQRLRGEIADARRTADSLNKTNPSPELAYSLAVLELLADNPNFKDVFDWLGRARAADAGLGRAPVMLIVACLMSQRIENARAELARLKSAQRSHPLLTEIEAYVNRATNPAATADAGTAAAPEGSAAVLPDAGGPSEPVAGGPSEPVAGGPSEPAAGGPGDSLADVIREGDTRLRLRRGVESLGRGELTRAELYFRSVIASRPNDTEALTGMGDVARRRGNTANAINYYQKVLSFNAQYLPALTALADLKWKTGDRAGAAALYRRIVDQVGESPGYGQMAARRLHELSEASSAKSGGASDGEKASPPATPAASTKVDLTDRPGKQP